MSRYITIIVFPQYNTETCKVYKMSCSYYRIAVPEGITKRELAYNARILRSLRYFDRFHGFSSHFLGKICFRIVITEESNHQSYRTCFSGKVSLLPYCLI